jgi:uncharacterized delta-60 repeat protein
MKTKITRTGLMAALGLGLLAVLALAQSVAYAADGDLDSSFDGDGRATTNFQDTIDEAHAVATQPDGKIVTAGTTQISDTDYDFSVARYNSDGSPDTTFGGGDGRVTTGLGGNYIDVAEAVAIQPDGKILAVGHWAGNDFAAVRYNPDGSLDTSFGGDGIVTHGFGLADKAFAVAIQDDGKIVMAGHANALSSGNVNFCLIRMNPDGSIDNTFDGDGIVTTDFFGNTDEAHAVAMQAGKIVVAGYAQVSGFNYDFALARYNPNGSLDNTFGGGDGKVTTDFFGGDDGALSMVLQPDGKIVAAGAFYSTGQGYDFGLIRYLPNGDLDTSFDSDGLQAVNFVGGTATEVAYGVTRQPYDGKIVAVGYAPVGGVNDFALVRLNLNGSLDSSFGVGGKVNHDFGGGVAIGYGVAVQADGKIVSAGTAYMGEPNSYDYALARYMSGNISNPTSTPTPNVTPTSCPIQFTDVPSGSTFHDYVRCLACREIISGYSDGTYRPGNSVTRGQLAKIVSNSAGYNEPHSVQSFEDVPVGSTFHLFIERLADRSIISGYACGGPGEPCVPPANLPYFRPNNSVTRGQTAKIVASAAGLPAPPPGQWTFQDVPQGSTFWQWIESLSSSGAISGYPCGADGEPCVPPENRYYFRPGNDVTRGQSAKIVANTFFPGCQTPSSVGK